ncbi:transposase [Virgibacillus dakarensis]|nr:transposase [Virgibacillus dakarensis]
MAGRRNKYPTHVQPYLNTIKGWCREGLTEQEICKRLGVGKSAFNVYKNEYSELMEALRQGKAEADYTVEDSLYKSAIGQYVTETTTKVTTNVYGDKEEIETVEETKTKFIPPSVPAQKMWLVNRTDKWKDKQEHNITQTTFVIDIEDEDDDNEE